MKKIYATILNQRNLFFKYSALGLLLIISASTKAQVNVTATAGSLTGVYATLGAAFTAINSSIHQGAITINLNAAVIDEGTVPATLNGNNADPANYTSVTISTTLPAVTVKGNPAAGYGVVQLYGASNITIDGGAAKKITFQNYTTATNISSSVIRVIVNSTSVTSAKNITIKNCIIEGHVVAGNAPANTNANLSPGLSYGIYFGGGARGLTNVAAPTSLVTVNTVAKLFQGEAATLTDAYAPIGSSVQNITISNNSINAVGRAIYFNGESQSVGSNLNINNNIIGSATIGTKGVYARGIFVNGSSDATITSNTIQNLSSYLPDTLVAIQVNKEIGGGDIFISNNTINNVSSGAATSGSVNGIMINSAENDFEINGNTIKTIKGAYSNTFGINGIFVNATGGTASIYNNKIDDISNNHATDFGPASGIRLFNVANGAGIFNNFISNVMQSGKNASGTNIDPSKIASGILIESGSFHQILHNSIHLYGALPASPAITAVACLTIKDINNKNLTIKNNIFSNKVSTTALGAMVGVFFPVLPASASGTNIVMNNNAFYVTDATGNGMAYAGPFWQASNLYKSSTFEPRSSTGGWRNASVQFGALAVNNDDHSYATVTAAPFISNSDLHIVNASTTGLESGGVPVGISSDIDNAARNTTWPDIGADEFTGTKDDKLPPYITYTKLSEGYCNIGVNRSLAVTITDPSGIGTGTGQPLLYWSTDNATWTAVTGVQAGSVYTFSFGSSAILGQTVYYFVAAQDAATSPTVGTNPSTGTGNWTTSPPKITIYPDPPNFFVIGTALPAGNYLVGSGEPAPFNNLPNAINAYNTSCLGGNIIFTLKDNNYNVTSQLDIFNIEGNATHTLTIRPKSSNTKITGSLPDGSAIFRLNGADYITFDGTDSTTNTPKSLTIENTGAGSAIWVASNGSNGALNNTIKNAIVKGGNSNTSFAAIMQSSGEEQGGLAEAQNNNNVYTNNTINTAQYGIGLVGGGTNNDQGNIISGNLIGSATAANYIGFRGIFIAQQTGVNITGNEITGVSCDIGSSETSTNMPSGIYVAGKITNGKIQKNKLHNIVNTRNNIGGWAIDAISLKSSNATTGLEISNNFIWDYTNVGWSGSSPQFSAVGLRINSGGGYKIYYNTINSTTAALPYTATTGIQNVPFAIYATDGNLDVRNNIFANTRTTFDRISIYVNTSNTVFSNIDYNDYYTTGSNLGYLGSLRPNIASWQSATGKDAHSVSVIPEFFGGTPAAFDNHLKPISPLNHLGVVIAGITTDIDGDTRSVGTGPNAPDIGADEFVAPTCSDPSAAVFSSSISKDSVCVSETISLTASGYPIGELTVFNWQSSTNSAAGPFTDIPGAITPSLYSGNASTETWYRLRVTCGANSGYSPVQHVVVNNPAILSRTGATRCGFGTVNLAATAAAGLTVNWYEDASTTIPLFTGSNYSPTVNATTTFYVDATAGGSTGTVGLVSPSAGSSIGTQTIDWEMYFNVLQPTTLKSIDIYPMVAGEPYILFLRNSSGTTLATYNVTTTVGGGATPQTVIINYSFAAPGNDYYLYTDLPSSGVRRNEGGATYPYTSSAINITGNGFTSTYFMGMYNWKFSSGCTSNRLPVVATVTSAPAINITNGSSVSICSGSDTTLVVTGDPSYTNYTWSLTPGGAVVHTGASYNVNPTVNTLYYVEAATPSGQAGCRNITQTTVIVKPVPTPLTLQLTPNSTNFCNGQIPLKSVITGGVLDSIYALQQDFNGATNDWTTTNNTVNSTNPERAEWTLRPDGYIRGGYGPFTSNDNSQFYLSDADWPGSGSTTDVQLTSPTFSLAGFTEAGLTFYHSYTKYTNDIYARVEISKDGGSTWTLLKNYTTTQGTRTAFALETIPLDSATYMGQTNLKLRFNYKSNWGFQWAIDNVNLMGKQQLNVTWTPNYQMFLGYGQVGPDYFGTNPYVLGTNAPTVYVQPFVDTTYTAIVTSPGGCSKSASLHVVTINNPVSVTNTTPSLPPNICQQTPFTLTETGVNAGTNPNSFQWYDTLTNTVLGNGANLTLNGPGSPLPAGTYKIRGKLVSNITCATNNPALTSDIITITVDSILPLGVTITSNVPSICAGSNVTFTALGVNGGLNPGYQWQINGSNVPGATNPTFTTNTLVAGDAVRVVITSDEKCTFGTTANSNSISITVNPLLPVSVSISANPGVNICVGTNVTFTASPTNGGGTPTYQWYKNGSLLPGETNSTYTSNTLANNDQVYVVLTSSETCQSGGPATSNTLTIVETGSVPVSVSLSYPGAPGPICGTGAITYTATGVNPGLTPIYEFSVGGTPMQTSASNTFTTTVSSGNVVSVKLTSSLSCATGNPATATLGAAVVTPIPAAPSVTPAGPLPICAGSSAILTSSIATGITWSTTATTQTISVSAAGNYSVTQTVNGCTSAPSNVVVVSIKPLPAKPTVTAGGPTTFCESGSVNLTAAAATGGATYLWSTGATTQTISASTTGSYTVQYVLNGCNGPASDPVSVTVTPAPVVTITGPTNFCGAPLLLTANATTSAGTITGYQWKLGGANIVGATSSTYSATAIGNYTVTVTNSLTCSTTSAIHTVVNDISPMIGVYTISTAPASCTNFQSFKTAINALNVRKIAGNVTFNVTPGFVEPTLTSTLSLGNDTLNASVGAFTITFQKNGVGVNPLIKAYAGGTMNPNSTAPDGIWAISGTDNVTIDGIDLLDENTSTPATMDYGYGFFKLNIAGVDGVQNAIIKNCVVTMSKVNDGSGGANMPEGAKGIMFINGTQTAATTALTPTTSAGTNSNNKIYGNTINFSQHPIALYGYNAPSPYTLGDTNNDIGGNSAATGNTVLNYGSSAGTLTATGIRVNYQWGVNISYNTINNNNGSGFDYQGILKGILAEKADDANATVSNNTITLNKSGTTTAVTAMEITLGQRSSAAITNVVNANNNTIKDCNYLAPTTGIFMGMTFAPLNAANTYNINGNTFSNIKINGSAAHVILNGPNTGLAVPISNVFTNNNTFTGIIRGGSGNARIVFMPGNSAITNWTADNNLFDGIESNTTGTMDVLFTQSQNAVNVNFTNNILRNIGTNSTGIVNGISEFGNNGGVKLISNNQVYNFYTSASGTGGATFTGISAKSGIATVENNVVHSLNSTGTTGGIAGTITGILVSYAPTYLGNEKVIVRNNKIYDLSSNTTRNGNVIIGLSIGNVPEATVYNNYISDLRAPFVNNNDAIRGISNTNALANPNSITNLYYNTVFLNATSTQTNFGSSAIYANSFSAATTAALDMRNNIFYNASVPGSGGFSVAYRRSAGTFANYNSTSNYNLYYAGAPGASNLIFFEGTNKYQTLAAYKAIAGLAPRDVNSISAEPIFVNSTTAPYDLHLDANYNCTIEGAGNNAGILIQTDFDGDVRQTVSPFKTDIGADEFNGPAGGPFTWKGVNTNWEDKVNWCSGVPDASSAVIIPAGAPNYPILVTATNKAGTITIDPNANITITTGTLTVSGATFNVNGTLINNGMIVFNGTMPQSFPIGTGSIAAMKGIEVNNTSVGVGSGITFNKNFGIDSILKPTKGNINLSNSTITLKSTAVQTAQVSALGAGVAFNYSGTGKFIGEQFIRSAGRAGWRFITAQTNTSQTIRESWQENGITASTGYGMQIVGPSSAGTGFDLNNSLPSLKTYTPATNNYTTVPGTNVPVKNDIGYLAFVRGDRSMTTVGPTNNTILRTEGPIVTGNKNVTGTAVVGDFIPVGNPYPSAIDFSNITKTAGIGNLFYVWDPKLGGAYGYGKWQSIVEATPGMFTATPGGGSYPSGPGSFPIRIESGQAFLLNVSPGFVGPNYTIGFTEAVKSSGSNNVTRPESFNGKTLITNLYRVSNTDAVLLDGVRIDFDNAWSSGLDIYDAVKANNNDGGLGISSNSKTISVERRPELVVTDTIQFVNSSLPRAQYQLEIMPTNIGNPTLQAYLEDKYLNTKTPISLEESQMISFTIDENSGSAASDRFRIVFNVLRPLPVTFTRVEAVAVDKDVKINWVVDNEINIRNYNVERSVDGRNFQSVGTVEAGSNYNFLDLRPGIGKFFYRIRSNDISGEFKYSNIVSVVIGAQPTIITIYPNPIKDNRLVNVNIKSAVKGEYMLRVINQVGQVILTKKLVHAGGSVVYDVELGQFLTKGSYNLQIIDPEKVKTIYKFVY